MKIHYKVKEIHSKVYLVTTKDSYDLAMLFCRVQEFYESPFKQIKGHGFSMPEFQRMYAKKFGDGVFTYPHDWVGFNVPSSAIHDCYSGHHQIDINEYDDEMIGIYYDCLPDDETFYVIGSPEGDDDTIKHETAHALYSLHKNYKKEADKIVKSLDKEIYNSMKNNLKALGYCSAVTNDEIQAYLVSNVSAICDFSPSKIKKQKQAIDNLFENFKGD